MTNSLCAGLTTDNEKAKAIFNYVRDVIMTCSYEENTLYENSFRGYYNVTFGNETKNGAVGTLNAKEGNDTDKTHLLIAMLRTAGIPARYCHGSCKFIGITHDITQSIKGNDYTDHVWAECLIDDKWVPADAACEAESNVDLPDEYRSKYKTNQFGKIITWDTKDYKLHGYYDGLNF
jgi:transglutaminase-like putative cysteine protease